MKKLLAIMVLGLLFSGNAYSETFHIKCLLVKESKPLYTKLGEKFYEYFTINPEKGFAKRTASGLPNEMEKDNSIYQQTNFANNNKHFVWGKSFVENNIDFYHFYQIEIKKLKKKGKANMAYVSNLVVGLDGMVREIQDGFKCNRIDKAPQFVD